MKNFINLRVVGRMARSMGDGWVTTWPSASRKPVARANDDTTVVIQVGCPWNLYTIIIKYKRLFEQ